MKRTGITLAVALVLWGGAGINEASAQFGSMGQHSPFRSSQTFGLIRTQTEANRIALEQQAALRLNPNGSLQVPGANEQQSSQNPLGGLQTGHPVTFFDYNQYFPLVPPGVSNTGLQTGFGSGISNSPYGYNNNNNGMNAHFIFGSGGNRR